MNVLTPHCLYINSIQFICFRLTILNIRYTIKETYNRDVDAIKNAKRVANDTHRLYTNTVLEIKLI